MNLRHFLQHVVVSTAIAIFVPAALQAENQPAASIDGQQELLQLLRETPSVAGAVARDPSLLTEQSYIQRANPRLAKFLAAHPEIVHNPDYYLFNNLSGANNNRQRALERQLWPQYLQNGDSQNAASRTQDAVLLTFVNDDLVPIIVVPFFFFCIAWSIRAIVAGRRQSKILKAQSDLQSHLIDKLGSSQELTAYLASDAGQKLLGGFGAEPLSAAAPVQTTLPFSFERILLPLQIGAVLVLLSAGALVLRLASHEGAAQVSLFATTIVLLTAGLGFILSAGIAWGMAKKFGILPARAEEESTSAIDRP